MTTDDRILELKQKIEQKKGDVSSDKFKPLTSCVFSFNNNTYNINTMDENDLLVWGGILFNIMWYWGEDILFN